MSKSSRKAQPKKAAAFKASAFTKTGTRPRLKRDLHSASPVLLIVRDIHQLYGYSESAIRHAMRERGFPPGFKDGRRHLWFKTDVDAYFQRLAAGQGGAA